MKATFLYFIDQVFILSKICICRLCVHFSTGILPDIVGNYDKGIVFCHYVCKKSKHVWIKGISYIN